MKSLFAAFLICLVFPCFGQNIDSLKKIAASSHSSEKRLKATLELADYFSTKNANETLRAAKTGLAIEAKSSNMRNRGLLLQDLGKAYYLRGR